VLLQPASQSITVTLAARSVGVRHAARHHRITMTRAQQLAASLSQPQPSQ
jgi:hypothetical protein